VRGTSSSGSDDSPSDAVEDHSQLRNGLKLIWEGLLPVGSVGIDEDFFLLGGDSLLAAQMLIEVEHQMGVTIPMGELVHAHTVRELAEVLGRLTSERGRQASTAVCVQRGDPTRPLLWFFPDLQGSAYRVRHVAAALGADQPVWSVESPLLSGEPNRFTRLSNFVVRFLDDLRRVQPEGPYWLAGYSFGGICAYEVARQLRAEGHEVGFLGVVDVGPGYRGPGWHASRSPLRPWFGIAKPLQEGSSLLDQAKHLRAMVSSNPVGALRHLEVRSGMYRIVDPLRFRADIRRHGRVRPEWRLWYAWEEHWKMAAEEWDRTSASPVDLDLFWADDSASADATMGWGPLVDRVTVHRFRGQHEGVLEPRGANDLASVLRTAIDRSMPADDDRRDAAEGV
jgi:acyl carrier protein